MKRLVPNPEYEQGPFELTFIGQPGVELPMPRRFKITPPPEVWHDNDKFAEWVKANSIPPFIEVDEP